MERDLKSTHTNRRTFLKASGVAVFAAAAGGGALRAVAQTASPMASPAVIPSSFPSPSASPSVAVSKGDWPTFGYDYAQTRHVPFDQVTKDNVKKLGRVWSFDFLKADPNIPPGQECFPIVVDGILYATTSYDHVFAFDAKSGKQLWHWAPEQIGFFKNFGLDFNRGVAYGEGKVFLLTLDMRIVAIDAKTGKLVKEIHIGDTVAGATPELGYYETTTPVYYKGVLYIGSSGGDNGIRGFLMAYKASDLTPAWANPYWTVPPAGQDWRKEGQFHGGGASWMPATLDPETDTLYAPVGNASPDLYGASRPGSNPNTDGIVAVKALTGEQLWVKQTLTRDLWDYDVAAPIVLMTTMVGGKKQKVVAVGTKAGQWWCWDAANGGVIYDGVPFAKIDHPEPTEKGVIVSPGPLGGANYAPQSYDPTTNYYLICNVEFPALLTLATKEQIAQRAPGDLDLGGTFDFATNVTPYGTYVAIDMGTGKIVYDKKVPGPLRGGFTTTATGLGFFGGTTGDENLHAIDTSTGEILWSFGVGGGVGAAPIIYTVDDTEYIALTVGGAIGSPGAISKIEVFALGGNTEQIAPSTPVPAPMETMPDKAHWLVRDPNRTQGVIFNAIAAYSNDNNGMDFNGYGNGQMTLTVPVGWTLEIKLWNKSTRLPHSIMATTQEELGKGSDFTPAFVGAYAPTSAVSGFIGDQPVVWGASELNMSKAGTYVLLCAVPGHAAQGMWDTLKVDPNAKEPSLTTPTETIPMAASASAATPVASPAATPFPG